MKTKEELAIEYLKSKGITSTSKYHNYDYLYKVMLELSKENIK